MDSILICGANYPRPVGCHSGIMISFVRQFIHQMRHRHLERQENPEVPF
jgi:hypothetical protein